MAGAHCPLSLFAVVLMVFIGKEGSLEMLTGCTNGKGLEVSLLIDLLSIMFYDHWNMLSALIMTLGANSLRNLGVTKEL